ncbi:MAG: aminotransferase class V-fold PLP-dependent enzyme [Pseudodesulfovibrio sp.]|nr:aminotransferase class V-fold PLP-dependent enzyme [Pseudodesulfovibrio sp.]
MDKLIYLDNGATSFPKPEEVYAFMDSFHRSNGVSPGRSGCDLSIETGTVIEEARLALTGYFNGTDPDRLVFALNSTDGLNLVISGLLSPGDHVITTNVEHNAVLRPLHHQALYNGVEVDHVPFDGSGFVNPEDFIPLFKENTRLVVVNHASNVIGTVQPIREIGRICREHGVTFLVDASQTAGKIPVDMVENNIDVVAFTGHKSLLGPTGIGGFYVREGVDIRHTRAGGTGVKSAQLHHLEEYPYRMEYGTPNIVGIAGLLAGFRWIKCRGMEDIHAHEMALTRLFVQGLQDIEGVTLYCQDDLANHISVVSFNVDGFEASNVGTIIDGEYNIVCRTGLQCAPFVHKQLGTDTIHGTVRMGFGPFNTKEHIRVAVDAVREIAGTYGK